MNICKLSTQIEILLFMRSKKIKYGALIFQVMFDTVVHVVI